MIPLQEARDHIIGAVEPLATEVVGVADALGLVLAQDVVASDAIPPFPNTAMDGFAVRSADTAGAPTTLDVVGTIAAGDSGDTPVGPGQAARIMTGAPIPPGADAIIMVELTELSDDGTAVTVAESVPVGNHIRHAGEDVEPGVTVFDSGTVLTPGHLGMLCSLGAFEVSVRRRPRVGVISTGDELVDGPGDLRHGQIRDSNRRTLLALLEESGFEPVDLGLVRDEPEALKAAIEGASSHCDAMLSSGGVSMGAFDYVKVVLDEIGEMRWMQIAIKPAKPLAFGFVQSMPVFGLPGNPVSSMVSFELFARPALRKMAGHADFDRPKVRAIVDNDLLRHPDGKTHFARIVAEYRDGAYHVRSAGGQGSHQLRAMADANALAVIPDGPGARVGDTIDAILLDR